MTRFFDPQNGKVYQVNGTTVTQFTGRPCFESNVLYLHGHRTSQTNFKSKKILNNWLKMMGFTEGTCI